MTESLKQLIQTYVKCYIESEQGQSLIKHTMIKYINQQCLTRFTSFWNEATDPFSFLYCPYKQINLLIKQCDSVSCLLDKENNQTDLDNLSLIVCGIYECCNQVSTYIEDVTFIHTPSTEKVDSIIENNKLLLSNLNSKSAQEDLLTFSKEDFLMLADEFQHLESYNGTERADESKLRKYGYSVAQDSFLSDSARQDLLQKLISTNTVSKGYVVSYLEHIIQINGKKASNYIALSKWKSDLEYVLKL